MSNPRNNLTPAEPQATLLDAMSDDQALNALGPSWSEMSPAERVRYGRAAAESDPLLTALEHLGDLDVAIQLETAALLDRVEAHLKALETCVGLALYRERSARSASHGPQWWQAAP